MPRPCTATMHELRDSHGGPLGMKRLLDQRRNVCRPGHLSRRAIPPHAIPGSGSAMQTSCRDLSCLPHSPPRLLPHVPSPNTLQPSPDFWAAKPAWCQPWSILLTGSVISVGSWNVLHTWWITLPVGAGILVWWWLFLVLVPAAYARGGFPEEIEVDP
jgi:hypothetical protein